MDGIIAGIRPIFPVKRRPHRPRRTPRPPGGSPGGLQPRDPDPERAAVGKPVGVPAGHRAEAMQGMDRALGVGLDLGEMPEHQIAALREGRRDRPPAGEQVRCLPENPRVLHRRPARHHRIAAGLAKHANRIFGSFDIAIADDRDREGGLELRDRRPVRHPRVHLFCRPAVHRDSGRAFALADSAELEKIPAVRVQPEPEFDRQRDCEALPDLADHRRREIGIPHEGRARAALEHFVGGAPHVDVAHVGMQLLDDFGRCRHALDARAVNLNRNGPLFLVEDELPELARVTPGDRLRGDELHRDEAHAPDAAQHAPVETVRDPRHRGEDQGRIDGDGSVLQHPGIITGARSLASRLCPQRPAR